jgi:hypothetical protein
MPASSPGAFSKLSGRNAPPRLKRAAEGALAAEASRSRFSPIEKRRAAMARRLFFLSDGMAQACGQA